jgi:hypothetical protein
MTFLSFFSLHKSFKLGVVATTNSSAILEVHYSLLLAAKN